MQGNPVIKREMVDILRQPRSYMLGFSFLTILSAAVLAAWPDAISSSISSSQLSLKIFRIFAVAQLSLMTLLSGMLAAQSVVSESERGIFQLLMTTDVKPRHLLVGKLISTVGFFVLLSFSTLPIMSLCFLLGSVSTYEILGMYAACLKLTILVSATGLAASCYASTTFSATAANIVFALPVTAWCFYSAVTNPAYFELSNHSDFPYLVTAACFISLACGTARLNSYEDGQKDEPSVFETGLLTLNENNFPDNLLVGNAPLPFVSNPVFEKELQTEVIGRNVFMKIFIAGSMILGALAFLYSLVAESPMVFYMYMLAFGVMIAPSLSCNSITKEQEARTFEILRATPLPFSSIITGKLLASAYFAAVLFLVVLLPCSLGALGSGYYDLSDLLGFSVAAIATMIMSAMIGMAISMKAGTMAKSTLVTFTLLLALFAFPPLSIWFNGGSVTQPTAGYMALLSMSPACYVMSLVKEYGLRDHSTTILLYNLVFSVLITSLAFVWTMRQANQSE